MLSLGTCKPVRAQNLTNVLEPVSCCHCMESDLDIEKLSRRMSTSFLQNLLVKHHQERENEQSKMDECETGKEVEVDGKVPEEDPDRTPSPGDVPSGLGSVVKEQCACVAQLMHYIHGLVVLTSQQITEVERMRSQQAETTAKASMLYAENERLSQDRKHGGFQHDKQLEELRNLQEIIQQEKDKLEKERDKQHKILEAQRLQVQQAQDDLEKAKMEIKSQKDELKRQKETLQRQRDLFEVYKAQFSAERTSPHNSALQRERSESPGTRGISPSQRNPVPHVSGVDVQHKRSASDDLQYQDRHHSPVEGTERVRHDSGKTRLTGTNSSASLGAGIPMPLHLLSATNEQKLGHISQQLPYKLAGGSTSTPMSTSAKTSPTVTHVTTSSGLSRNASTGGIQQMLPLKLSSLSSASSLTASNTATGGATTTRMTPPGVGSKQSPSSSSRSNLGRTSSQPRIPSQPVTGNILPMKLAEKPRPKSASSATSGHGHQMSPHSQSKTSSGKKEPEIIYF